MSGPCATTDPVPPALSAPELDAGMWLGDRYRLIARLGRGGGGTVWRAFDEKVGEELALKLIGGGTDLERWRREVALARRISHGNVCRVYDLGEARGLRWVTMERIEGESLRALLQRGAVREPERVMRQLVDGVAAIHAAGVVHRDLKPENVVVDREGRAVIVDFGLARRPMTEEPVEAAAGSAELAGRVVTSHGAVLGTPRYMAPEQAAGEPADARSDVYALGLVLEEIASGGRGAAVATTAGAGEPAPRVPRPLPRRPWGAVIARCTARAPADRFPDAIAVRAVLATARRGWRRLAFGGAAAGIAVASAVALWLGLAGDRAALPGPLVQRRLTATAASPTDQPTSIAVSTDGRTLAYTVGLELVVRPIDGGRAQPVTMPRTPGGTPLTRLVDAAGFLPDGRVVAQILDHDHGWGVWALGPGAAPQLVYRGGERVIAAVSPRGDQLAVATAGAGLIAVPLAGGAGRPLALPRAGEHLVGPAWSPDGARLAFVRRVAGSELATLEAIDVARPASSQVLARIRLAEPVDHMTAWPTADRVVYVADEPGGAAVMAVAAAAPAAPVAVVRWPEEYVAQIGSGGSRIVVLRGTAERAIEAGSIDRRGYILNLESALPEQARAGPIAGWTPDGRLVHAADGDVVVRALHGPAIALATGSPDSLVGGEVIYHRGGELRAAAVGGGGDRAVLELPAIADGDLVRCAGDRGPPCVLAQVERTGVRYLRLDPVTGARGDELLRADVGRRSIHAMAVAPDGGTLAVVDGSNLVTLVPLGGSPAASQVGRRIERERLAPSAEAVAVSWSRDGASLLVSALAGGDDRASVIRLWPGGSRQLLLHSDRIRYGRVHEAPVGGGVAIETRELALDAWLIDGL